MDKFKEIQAKYSRQSQKSGARQRAAQPQNYLGWSNVQFVQQQQSGSLEKQGGVLARKTGKQQPPMQPQSALTARKTSRAGSKSPLHTNRKGSQHNLPPDAQPQNPHARGDVLRMPQRTRGAPRDLAANSRSSHNLSQRPKNLPRSKSPISSSSRGAKHAVPPENLLNPQVSLINEIEYHPSLDFVIKVLQKQQEKAP